MSYRLASYFKRGFTMSRRARIAHTKNEHPITYWTEKLALEKELLLKLLIYVGLHHTGIYAQRTSFYRLPYLNNETEKQRFDRFLKNLPPTKKKCIKHLSDYAMSMQSHRLE